MSARKMLLGVIGSCGGLLLAASVAAAATVSWTADTDGFWDVGANWSTGNPPQSGDDVVINRPSANVTVTHRSGTTSINTLTAAEAVVLSGGTLTIAADSALSGPFTQSGGTLGGAGKVTVGGPLTWTGGTMTGIGRTEANGGLRRRRLHD